MIGDFKSKAVGESCHIDSFRCAQSHSLVINPLLHRSSSVFHFPSYAAEFANKAVESDNRGDYQEALVNYQNAVEWFMTHMKYDKNPTSVAAIRGKVSLYFHYYFYSWKLTN